MATTGQNRRDRRSVRAVSWGVRAAWAVLLIGLVVSGAAALARLSNIHHADRAEFQVTANDVSATLASGLKRDVDAVGMLRAIASLEPDVTTRQFQQWHDEIGRGHATLLVQAM